MGVILKISVRNLLRQKRRNLLLGIGIAFGMSILIVANSFSHGLSDILLNKLLVLITGHIKVIMAEKNDRKNARAWNIIRDQERIKRVIQAQLQGEQDIFEVVQAEGRALANNKARNIAMIGVELNAAFFEQMQTSAGNPKDMLNPAIDHPILLPNMVAETLKLKVADTLAVGFETVYGQAQSARFTVVGIIRADIPFFENDAYVNLTLLKPLLGYKAYETGALKIVLRNIENPAFAIAQANRLHQALQPNVAGYAGLVQANGQTQPARIFAVTTEKDAQAQFAAHLRLVAGSLDTTLAAQDALLLSQPLAAQLGVKVGDPVHSTYETRFEGASPAKDYRVGAIFRANENMTNDMIFLNANAFYDTFFPVPPKQLAAPGRDNRLFPFLLKEWNLLARTEDETALALKYDALEDSNWRGAVMDIQTMHETASMVLKLELGMNLVTWLAVSILFAIILVGIVNTLRMTIRERTREIGTIRAIGMQRNDVRWSFILEVVLLTVFANLAGIALALLVMQLLSLIPLQGEGLMKIFLVDQHLYFVPTLANSVQNFLMIAVIALLTAFFPSGKAAQMSISEALRHYE